MTALLTAAKTQVQRFVALLRDPPDLTERAVAVEFIIGVYPNWEARITATKLAGPSKEEIQKMAEVGIQAVLQWAQSQGVPLKITGPPAPAPAPAKPLGGPAKNPLRGVRA